MKTGRVYSKPTNPRYMGCRIQRYGPRAEKLGIAVVTGHTARYAGWMNWSSSGASPFWVTRTTVVSTKQGCPPTAGSAHARSGRH